MQHKPLQATQNHLLDLLPRQNYERLAQYFEPVSLTYGQVLYEPGAIIEHVYFPCSGAISLLSVIGHQKAAEVAVIGCEGMVGASTAAGIDVSFFRAVVQVPGTAVRLTSARMLKEFKTHGAWNPALFHFNNLLLNQVAQTAACNRFHTVEARLARWLLTTRDRADSPRFYVTHEFLSRILGIRRVGISTAAAKLQESGLISYSRGKVELLDEAGLEASTCECYRVIKAMYNDCYTAQIIKQPKN